MTDPGGGALPQALADIVDDFHAVGQRERLQMLLEFSEGLPELPARLVDAPLEQVPECQSPIFLSTEVDADDRVHLYFKAPREAPTTRGFAGILREGLDGLPAREVLAVPDDVSSRLGLDAAVSPLRLRGMSGMLWRIKRQVREKSAAGQVAGT